MKFFITTILSFQYFKHILLPAGSHDFWWEIIRNVNVNFNEDPWYLLSDFLIAVSKILSLPFKSFTMMSWGVHLTCLRFTELFGCVDWCFPSNLGKYWPWFLQIFSTSFSLLIFWKSTNVGMLDGVSRFLKFIFSFILFSLYSLQWIITTDLSPSLLILYFDRSNFLMNLSNEFFMFSYDTFNNRIFICFYFC